MATVHAALAVGISFFDTAEMYGDGRSDRILGKALRGRRDRVVIAAKVSRTPMTRDAVIGACDQCLQRLQTDYIDLYQVHYWDRQTPLDETLLAFMDLKKAGKVRAIGVCNSGCRDLSEVMRYVSPATNQMPYSLLWRAIEFDTLPMCREKGIGVLSYSPLAQGLLTGSFGRRTTFRQAGSHAIVFPIEAGYPPRTGRRRSRRFYRSPDPSLDLRLGRYFTRASILGVGPCRRRGSCPRSSEREPPVNRGERRCSSHRAAERLSRPTFERDRRAEEGAGAESRSLAGGLSGLVRGIPGER